MLGSVGSLDWNEFRPYRIKTMNALNAVQLLIWVWSFAVCQVDVDCLSVSCGNVTGTVGKEVTLNCSLSKQFSECCIKYFSLRYSRIYSGSKICEEVFHDCEQRNIFTCRYTPTTVMKETFHFFIQANCSVQRADFTVKISEPVTPAPNIDIPDKPSANAKKSIPMLVSGVVIIIIILSLVIIYKKYPARFQKSMFQCNRQNDGDSRTESVL